MKSFEASAAKAGLVWTIVVSLTMTIWCAQTKLSPGFRHFEASLRMYEKESFQQSMELFHSHQISARGFYHTSTYKAFWREVIEEQLMIMDGKRNITSSSILSDQNRTPHSVDVARNTSRVSYHWTHTRFSSSVFELIDHLHMTVGGSAKEFSLVEDFVKSLFPRGHSESNIRDIKLFHNETIPRDEYEFANTTERANLDEIQHITSGEMATIYAMHDYCSEQNTQGQLSFVLYLHNKGSCCTHTKGDSEGLGRMGVVDWRDLMNAFLIEFPSICLRALLEGYSTCGVLYQNPAIYGGNFFWARLLSMTAENFIFNVTSDQLMEERINFGRHCGYNPFHCGVDLYHSRCPRSQYRPALVKLLASLVDDGVLPPNPTARSNNSLAYVREVCGSMREKPYIQQPYWGDWTKFPIRNPPGAETSAASQHYNGLSSNA